MLIEISVLFLGWWMKMVDEGLRIWNDRFIIFGVEYDKIIHPLLSYDLSGVWTSNHNHSSTITTANITILL